MFGSNKISNVVENAIKSNNVVDLDQAQQGKITLASLLLGLLIVLLLNLLVGPWLWNNILQKTRSSSPLADGMIPSHLGILFALIILLKFNL